MMTQENIPYTADEIKAMVKTCEKYNKALEKVKGLLKDQEMALHAREKLANVFPELTMSEDEKMKDYIKDVIQAAIIPKKENKQKMIAWLEKQGDTNETSAEWSEEDKQMILSIEQVMNCASLLNIVPEKIDNIKSWLKSLRPHKQWTPNAAQLIVIKDLIEDKNTSNVNKVILQGMLREIDDAYLQGICGAKHEIEKQSEQLDPDKVIGWIRENIPIYGNYVMIDRFKKDFGQ